MKIVYENNILHIYIYTLMLYCLQENGMIKKIEALNSSYTLFVPINDAVDSGDKIAVSSLVLTHFHFLFQLSHLHFSVLGAIQVLCNAF